MVLTLFAQAAAFESEPLHIALEDYGELFTNYEYSTGIIPSGSPVGVEFKIEAAGGASVEMEGTGNLTWPDALSLAFAGEPGTGIMILDGSLAAVTQITIDLSDYGYEGEFEIDRREITFDGTKFFDPFVMDGGIPDKVEIVDTTDSTQLIYYNYEILPGLQLQFQADMTPTFTAGFEGVSWVNNEGYATMEGQMMDLAPEAVADYDVLSTFRGAWNAGFSLVFTPSLDACAVILGCVTVVEFAFPIDLLTDRFEQDFPSQTLSFPLPLMNAGADSIDFGDIAPGNQATYNLAIGNDGSLSLYGTATIEGSSDFSIFPSDFNALPATEDGLTVSFAPSIEGSITGTLVLSSNDPTVPDLRIPLSGNGFVPPQDSDIGGYDSEAEITKQVSSCGCSQSTWGGAGLAFVGLGLLLLRRREA
jgi:hypothetical protein